MSARPQRLVARGHHAAPEDLQGPPRRDLGHRREAVAVDLKAGAGEERPLQDHLAKLRPLSGGSASEI